TVSAVRYCYADQRDLHSFPTRRSSDLCRPFVGTRRKSKDQLPSFPGNGGFIPHPDLDSGLGPGRGWWVRLAALPAGRAKPDGVRSEEHTSELQSRENLVCRLLLEKKKE